MDRRIHVAIFRSLASEGWVSLNRYADEVSAALVAHPEVAAQSYVLPERDTGQPKGAIQKILRYDWRASPKPPCV